MERAQTRSALAREHQEQRAEPSDNAQEEGVQPPQGPKDVKESSDPGTQQEAHDGKSRGRKRMASGSEDDDCNPAEKMAELVGRKSHNPPSNDENDSNSQGAMNTPGRAKKDLAKSDDWDDIFD